MKELDYAYREISKKIYSELAKHNLSIGESKQVLAQAIQELDCVKPWNKFHKKD